MKVKISHLLDTLSAFKDFLESQLYVKSAVYFNHSNGIFICFHHQFPVCLCLPELCGGTMDLRLQRGKNILLLKIMRAGECREDCDRYIDIKGQ